MGAAAILVAVGTAVRGLPGIEPDGRTVLTSDDALAQEKMPGSGVVLGGGAGGGGEEKLPAEKFLVAVGRKPLTEGLGLEACGVKLSKGTIEVDASLRTSCPTIYAIGDVIGGMLLAHEASAEGVAAAEIIAGHETKAPDRDKIPACIFCQPEVSTVGLSEEEAKRRGSKVLVSKFPFTALGRAGASGHTEGFGKMVAEG